MFRCCTATRANPLELFRVWLNLPAQQDGSRTLMFWNERIPLLHQRDDAGRSTVVRMPCARPGTAALFRAPRPRSLIGLVAPGACWTCRALRGTTPSVFFTGEAQARPTSTPTPP